MDRHFFKRMNAQKLKSSVQASRQVQLLVEDCDHQVNSHGNPDLRLHRIGTRPVVMLDSQMAFDPAEEQFDLPVPIIPRPLQRVANTKILATGGKKI